MDFLQLISQVFGSIVYMLLGLSGNGSFPRRLTAAEENMYIELMKNGDKNARSKLIEHNLRLVAYINRKYYSSTNDIDDLISIGTIGLIKAVDTYSPDKGIRLSSYASRCIDKAHRSQKPFLIQKRKNKLPFRRIGKYLEKYLIICGL